MSAIAEKFASKYGLSNEVSKMLKDQIELSIRGATTVENNEDVTSSDEEHHLELRVNDTDAKNWESKNELDCQDYSFLYYRNVG